MSSVYERFGVKSKKYLMCVPYSLTELHSDCQWFKINGDVYQSKVYPRCACGKLYVPLELDKSRCFYCIFMDKSYPQVKLAQF